MNLIKYTNSAFLTLLKDGFRSLFRKIGVDRAVLLGIISKSWNIIAMAITLMLIAHKFSLQIQGYYYAFLSIIGFQFLVELGLGNIIVQFTSHEWSRLSLDDTGQIIGERDALSRLQGLARFFFRWYYIASVMLTMGLCMGGYFFFSRNQEPNVNWLLPWISLCICNGAIFCLLPIWSLLEGCNQISKLYLYRLVQGIFLSVSLWIAILLGANLWAVVISNVVILICAGAFLWFKCKVFFRTLLFSNPASTCVNWIQEVLPLQLRVATTYLIGSFAFNLFVPVLFKYHGSSIAGQMGMTWSLASVVISMVSAWLSPKVPRFGILIAQKKYKELDDLLWSTSKIISYVAVVAAIIAWSIVYTLNMIKSPLASRFLSPLPTGLFILANVVSVISMPFAAYLRAHKKEPLLFVGVASGILVGLTTLVLGNYYSAIGVAVGYLSVNLILVPIVFIIWNRCRTEWHDDKFIHPVVLRNGKTTNETI